MWLVSWTPPPNFTLPERTLQCDPRSHFCLLKSLRAFPGALPLPRRPSCLGITQGLQLPP